MRTESYVVRIYRRGHPNRQSIVGVIEAVRTGWQKPFHSLQELADILASPAAGGGAGPLRIDGDADSIDDGSKS